MLKKLETGFSKPVPSGGLEFKKRFSFVPRICSLDDITMDISVFDPSVYDITFSVERRGKANPLRAFRSIDKPKTYYTVTFKPIDGAGLYLSEPWLLEYLDVNAASQQPKIEVSACTPEGYCERKSCTLFFGFFFGRQGKWQEQLRRVPAYFMGTGLQAWHLVSGVGNVLQLFCKEGLEAGAIRPHL